MRRRRPRKHKSSGAGKPERKPNRGTAPGRASAARNLTPIKIGAGVGVVAIGVAVVWSLARSSGGGSTFAPDSAPVRPAALASSLPPAPPGAKVPVNDVDPLTGKPITPTSPTTVYKGYVVAFCCNNSAGYKGGWARLSEPEKDAFIRRCLE